MQSSESLVAIHFFGYQSACLLINHQELTCKRVNMEKWFSLAQLLFHSLLFALDQHLSDILIDHLTEFSR